MENFARHHYENNVDQLVREELKQAGIPILELPCYMDTEVKTRYVGVLYGFFFYRAWTYWVCKGDMPLNIAEQIYRNYKGLHQRKENTYAFTFVVRNLHFKRKICNIKERSYL